MERRPPCRSGSYIMFAPVRPLLCNSAVYNMVRIGSLVVLVASVAACWFEYAFVLCALLDLRL